MMSESDAVSVLMLLGSVSALFIFAAGYAYGKHRGELETRKILLLDDQDDTGRWDYYTVYEGVDGSYSKDIPSAIMIEDGHAIVDQRHPGDRPTLTLIDGGKGKNS